MTVSVSASQLPLLSQQQLQQSLLRRDQRLADHVAQTALSVFTSLALSLSLSTAQALSLSLSLFLSLSLSLTLTVTACLD
jgi:hypothetical protein